MKCSLRQLAATALVLVLVAGSTALTVATAGPAGAALDPGAVTLHKTITRSHLDPDGRTRVVDSRNFSVSISATKALQGRQNVDVTWSGAHPTGDVQPDVNGMQASSQEYPVAILECRGTAATVEPETCWTHGTQARFVQNNNPTAGSEQAFPAWRLDRYAPAPDRGEVVGRPADASGCPQARSEHWTPFVGANGTVYGYGNSGCAGIPAEDNVVDASQSSVPDNATFAATSLDGTGSAKFDIFTEAENASLGCSAAVSCTMVVIPILGISCDPGGKSADSQPLPTTDVPSGATTIAAAAAGCEAEGNFPPGSLFAQNPPASLAVTGQYWWSASNWRNRIAVPLDFAPVSTACGQPSAGQQSAYIYGSELMTEATGRWAPKFCADPKLFQFTHVQTSDTLAKSLLRAPALNRVYAAFSSQSPPAGFGIPVVQAPVAVTGFSISYNVDNAAGQPITNLRLTPRLLAKLMTESYREDNFDRFVSGQFPYLKNNPINVTDDPEFMALNPGIHIPDGSPGPATLIQLNGGSDVTYALTSYIAADPEAMAWLNGQPDPWGMVVNKYYNLKNPDTTLTMPTDTWPFSEETIPDFLGQVPCEVSDKIPWLNAVAAPTSSLLAVSLAVQFAAPTAKISCATIDGSGQGATQWVSVGRSVPGVRFVIGITSIAQAHRYDLESAALQSQSYVADPKAKFTDGTGRVFVNPSTASMAAAAATLTADPNSGTWPISYETLRSTAGAYPGTMVVYADIPTSGLTPALAQDYAQFLQFAASSGQQPGTGFGQLPDGYLPMTASNKLGALASYTQRAAVDVRAQDGRITPIDPPAPLAPAAQGTSSSGSGAISSPSLSNSTSQVASAGSAAPTSAAGPGSPAPPTGPSVSLAAAARIRTPGVTSGLSGVLVPALVGVAVLGSLLSVGSIFARRPIRRRR